MYLFKNFFRIFLYTTLVGNILFADFADFSLSTKEKLWIKQHPQITACVESDWAPFSYLGSDAQVTGLSKDYLDAVSLVAGINIVYRPYDSWKEIIADAKAGKCDILNGLYYRKERSEYILFTEPYLHMKEYFFVREDSEDINSMEEIGTKSVAVVKGYATTQWLRKKYPKIKLIEKNTIAKCLYAVSSGEADLFIGDSPSARYNMEENFISGIRMCGINKERQDRLLRMGVKKEYRALLEILNKGILEMDESYKKEIKNRWMAEMQQKTNWMLVLLIIGFISLVALVVGIFNYRLRKLVYKKTKELQELNRNLEEKVKVRTRELLNMNDKLLLAANTDPMTGIYNRRYFFDVSHKILAISKQDNLPITISMLDIDHFKKVNDTYGHHIGDDVIKEIAEQVQISLSEDDFAIRFGGEEFLIVWIGADKKIAKEKCEKLRESISKCHPINVDPKVKVTVSMGLSQMLSSDKDIDTIVKRADEALYEAKHSGRNRVCIYKNNKLKLRRFVKEI